MSDFTIGRSRPHHPAGRSTRQLRAEAIAAHDIESIRGSEQLTRITDFAAALCGAPVALVNLVEQHRQHFIARTGYDPPEGPPETSFCTVAMLEPGIMVVPDATRDPRFADNPQVTGAPFIRFYAGAPLVSDDGVPLGSLCVIDTVPHDGLTPLQHQGLTTLADAVMARLRDSRDAAAWRATENATHRALNESHNRFRVLADAMPQMVWSTLPDGYHDYYNARWYEFTGVPEGSTDGEEWNGMFHPDDQPRAWEAWRRSLESGEPYQIEYRLRRADGDYRWTLGRALPLRDESGAIVRWFGTCTDIHEQKEASEEREVIAQELSHRIKNIFAVIAGLVGFAARSKPELASVTEDLRERITALGRAHDFVRPAQREFPARSVAEQPARAAGRAVPPLSVSRSGADRHQGQRCRDRRSLGHAAGPAVPRACHQRDQIWRAGQRCGTNRARHHRGGRRHRPALDRSGRPARDEARTQ